MPEQPLEEIRVTALQKKTLEAIQKQYDFFKSVIRKPGEELAWKIEIIGSDRGDGYKRITVHSQSNIYLSERK